MIDRKRSTSCIFVGLLVLSSYSCWAAAVDSTWQGGSGNWSDAGHWDYPSGGYPDNTTSDVFNAYIHGTASDPIVSLDTSVTLDYLLNQETLTMTGQTLTLATALGFDNAGTLNINYYGSSSRTSTINGVVTNDGTINLNRYSYYGSVGNLIYNASDLFGSGTINVTQNAALTLNQSTDLHDNVVDLNGSYFRADSGYTGGQVNGYGYLRGLLGGPIAVENGTMQFEADSTIQDTGSLDITGTGFLNMASRTLTNAGQLTIQDGGRLDMISSTLSHQGADATTIRDGGTLNINYSGSSSRTSTINGAITNDGTINLNRYDYYGSVGNLTYNAADLFGVGTINVAQDARLLLSQDTDLHDNSVHLNGGRFQSDAGYKGGQISGYGYLQGLFGGPIVVGGGTMQIGSDSTIGDTSSLDVWNTGVLQVNSKTLTNEGQLTVQDGGSLKMTMATLSNQGAGATIIQSGGGFDMTGSTLSHEDAGATTIEAGGTLNIKYYGSSSQTSEINGGVTNEGTINLHRYSYYGSVGNLTYNAADLFGSGTVNVVLGASLLLGQDTDLHDNTVNLNGGYFRADSGYTGGQVNGYGYLRGLLGGPIAVEVGTMRFEADSTIQDTGSLDVTSTGVLDMASRALTNAGQVTVQDGGTLDMMGTTVSHQGAGATTIQDGGTVNINYSGSSSRTSTINGAITNDGTINLHRYSYYGSVGNLTYNAADLFGSGTINVAQDARLLLSQDTNLHDNTMNLNGGRFRADAGYTGGQVNGYGYLRGLLGGPIVVEGGTMRFEADSTIQDTGSLDVTNTGALDTTSHSLTNAGRLTVQNGGTVSNTGTINNAGIVVNNGTMNNVGMFNNLGRYQGTGAFVGLLDSGFGSIAPGNSVGTMTVAGNFLLSDAGLLDIEIGGFDPGEYDLLDITGSASFLDGGTIALSFLSGYDIAGDIGDGESSSLMFLEAGDGIDGFFSTVSYDFLGTPSGFVYDVYQQDNGLWFSATNTRTGPGPEPVPAPGAALLTALGATLVGCIRRRFA